MVSIARKNLFHDKTRFLISIGGVAFSIFLILYFISLYYGFDYLLEGFVLNQDADIWVLQKGKTDFFRGSSRLPDELAPLLEQHGGVKSVHRLASRTLKVGEEENMTLIVAGYETRSELGGPWNIVKGKTRPRAYEIIIDRVFARKNNLKIHDTIRIVDKDFRIVGISDYTSVLMWQYSFIKYEDAIEVFGQLRSDYLMLQVQNPEFAKSLISGIENSFNVNAFTKQEFLKNNKELIREGFVPILLAVVFIGVIVGTSFVAVTIYTITIERIKEYGILKAIGASNKQLYKIIFEQSITITAIGFILGTLITMIAVTLTYHLFPELTAIITINSIFIMAGISLGISILASYIPIKRVARVDPLMIFR